MTRRPAALACAAGLLLLLVAGVYLQTGGFGFIEVYDDHYYLADNPHVTKGLTADGVRWALTGRYKPYWQPVTMLSHMLDVQLFGVRSGPHHLVNAGFHALNAVLLFLLLQAMTGAVGRSLAAAALFAAHPLHVESVAWVAERKDVLSTCLLLLTLLAYLRSCRRPGTARYGVATAAFAAGLMAKPMLVTLPIALLLLDWWPLGRWRPHARGTAAAQPGATVRLLAEKAPLLAFSCAVALITISVQLELGALTAVGRLPVAARLANALVSIAQYLGKLLWPVDLTVVYPHPGAAIPAWQAAAALLLAAFLTRIALRAHRSRPWFAAGWLWFLLALVPVLGIVQSGVQSMADRFAYVPAMGLYVAAAWGAGALASRFRTGPPLLGVVAAVAVVSLALAARSQARYWRDSVTLFSRAVAVTIDNAEAHKTLGKALLLSGRPGDALEHSREALRLLPASAEVHNDLGNALYRTGAREEAARHFREAVRLRPDYVEALANLGTILSDRGELAEAVAHYRRALAVSPGRATLHNNLGVALLRLGSTAEAAESFAEALRIDPGNARARANLALARSRAATSPAAR